MLNGSVVVVPSEFPLTPDAGAYLAIPKQIRPLLIAMLTYACKNPVPALACSVPTTEGGPYERLRAGSRSVRESMNSLNQYVLRQYGQAGFMLVVHGGAIEAPPERLSMNHVRLVCCQDLSSTIWVLPTGSVAADAVVATARTADQGSRLVETGGVRVTILDHTALLARAS